MIPNKLIIFYFKLILTRRRNSWSYKFIN